MGEFSKEIKVNDYKKLRYDINDGFVPVHIITASDVKDCPKTIKFCRWDDYSFKSWSAIKYEEYKVLKNKLHTFKKNHPLYIPLLHLLNGEKELIIDDDETYELNKKYMRIFLDKDNISIEFINNLDEEQIFEKFSIFIKNIGFDLRSKIDCLDKDTKERLYFFFKEVFNLFKEEYHQITIEEYLINNDNLSLRESKKYVKKLK